MKITVKLSTIMQAFLRDVKCTIDLTDDDYFYYVCLNGVTEHDLPLVRQIIADCGVKGECNALLGHYCITCSLWKKSC